MNVLLMGLRAAGKTTIGRLLADRLKVTFVDLDEQTLREFDETSVREVWSRHGEAVWRNMEARSLALLLVGERHVVGLGGGTPMIPAAAVVIKAHAEQERVRTVYLHASPDVLCSRLQQEPGDRPPLIDGLSEGDEVEAIYRQRDPVYRALSDVVIEVGESEPKAIAGVIDEWLGGMQRR